ncbi:MAG TPA: protein kinase [Bryobacteraceae bacterium]|nr:protein kinase [Bryobacteraceae bacterium]
MDRIGRYKIVRELGRGAMGVVYHAIDPNIGRPVAIKTIRLGDGRTPEEQERLRERLFREARSAGMLSHPGIVTIYDVEQQGELAYIAMEYVDGPTLDSILSRAEPIPPDQMFSVLAQTAAALDYAHGKGIVHRDIKPANIMIAADGTAKIADFGIAKITSNDQLTMTGTIVGTPHYMSPEQVQGQAIDGRSDQFSLAVIAYEMLTGEKPYTGEHLTTVVYKIVAEEPVPPHRLNATLAGAIDNVLRKALSKKPDGRYGTCQEFAQSLEKACAASRGWKTMARGGSLNEPTVVEAAVPKPAVKLPPARNPRADSTTVERAARKSGFVPFLMTVLGVTAVLAVIGWKAGPWLSQNLRSDAPSAIAQPKAPPPAVSAPAAAPSVTPTNPETVTPAAPKPETAQAEAPPSQAPATQAPPVPVRPDQTKPSPMPPPRASTAVEETPRRPVTPATPPRSVPATAQAVTVVSSPSGATATLDGRPDTACTTPCSIAALPGRHAISFVLPGYDVERREVEIGTGPLEVPTVILRAPGGTLMLTTTPTGASISVNGKKLAQTTPAQITLAPGNYTVTVEKDGKLITRSVDVHNGISYLKLQLE